jgi:FkbM family methyltransferase
MNPSYLISECAFSLRHGRRLTDQWRLVRNCVRSRFPWRKSAGIDLVHFRVGSRELTVALRRETTDTAVLMQIFHYGEYDAPGVRWGEIETIVDAGANIGLSSLFLLSRANARRVLAVEPEPSNLEILRRNVTTLNRTIVDVLPAALWTEAGPLTLHLDRASVSHSVDPRSSGNLTVAGVTPEDLVERAGGKIDLFKIDVEGAEKDLFASPSLGRWAPAVRYFLIECHSHFGFGASPAFIRGALAPYGFTVSVYDEAKGLVFAARDRS